MATMEWLAMFLATKVVLLENGFLDHKPLLAYLTSFSKSRQKPWCFKHMWLEEEGCRDTIEQLGFMTPHVSL